MAAKKKTGGASKKVTIEVDAETLKKLADAASALSDLAEAFIMCCDEPSVRAKSKKAPKKAAKKK